MCFKPWYCPQLNEDLLIQRRHDIIDGSMGKQFRIYLMTKMFMNGGEDGMGSYMKLFILRVFGVESPFNFGFIVSLWLRV